MSVARLARLARLVLLASLALALPSCVSAELGADELRGHLRWLADDAREGRGAGTLGLAETADYIENAFRQWGMAPGWEGQSFRQAFPVPLDIRVGERTSLVLGRTTLRLGTDFIPMAPSDAGRVSGSLLFLGYGVKTAGDGSGRAYDDYAGMDASGKIAVVLPGGPQVRDLTGEAARTLTTEGHFPAPWFTKIVEAKAHGAVALLALVPVLPDPAQSGIIIAKEDSPARAPGFAPAPGSLPAAPTAAARAGTPPFVAAFVTEEALARALGPAMAELQAATDSLQATGNPASRLLGRSAATLSFDLEKKTVLVENVIGRLPGRDPALAGRALVVGAHYDHLGRHRSSLEIMNGADDNASGVAVLLEVAQALAAARPRRTIIFVGFAGEELGLLGSSYFVEHLPFAADSCLAMINLDTVGRPVDGRLFVLGTGAAREFPAVLAEVRAIRGLNPVPVAACYPSSDQWSFLRARIPALHLFAGIQGDYHRPTDDWEKIDYDGLARVALFTLRLVSALAERTEPLTVENVPAAAAAGAASPPAPRAYLGTIPDFAYEGTGVRLSGVSPGSPAEGAGLRQGDVVLKIADMTVDNLMDLTAALKEHHAGEEVEVIVRREASELRVRVTLGTRP